jgi:hypothetical protein
VAKISNHTAAATVHTVQMTKWTRSFTNFISLKNGKFQRNNRFHICNTPLLPPACGACHATPSASLNLEFCKFSQKIDDEAEGCVESAMPTPSIEQLKRALAIAEQIESLKSQLDSLVAGGSLPAVQPVEKAVAGKRFVSAESRAKMAAAQAARWAKRKGPSAGPATAVALPSAASALPAAPKGKKKGGLTAEGRAKIVAALKARHAANRKNKM